MLRIYFSKKENNNYLAEIKQIYVLPLTLMKKTQQNADI